VVAGAGFEPATFGL